MDYFTVDSAAAIRARSAANARAAGAASVPAQERAIPARVTVRTYRNGLGDCHLVTLRGDGGKAFRMLIDGGFALAPTDAVLQQVVCDIAQETGGALDLLVATYKRSDQLSGVQAADAFGRLGVGEVWMAWTEDPNDPAATVLRDQREHVLDQLRLAGARVQLRGTDAEARAINAVLESFGAAGRRSSADALAGVRAKTRAPAYCSPGQVPRDLPDVGARIYVLGPSRGQASSTKTQPSQREAEPSAIALDEILQKAVPPMDGQAADNPFSTLYSIPERVARSMPFFQQHYWEDAPWRRIDTAWIADSTRYALALDRVTTNTGLVLAIELEGGDVLLFAADSQADSWQSWAEQTWSVRGRKVDGRDLLARAVFYKGGHSGSFNAALGKDGLEQMRKLRFAVIPVGQAAALSMQRGEVPLESLQLALADATRDGGYVLRTDQDAPAAALGKGVTATAGYFDVQL